MVAQMSNGEFLGMPADVIGNIPSVRVVGKSTTEIVNHRGLRSFNDTEIQISTKVGLLLIEGCGLAITGISAECIRIQGDIRKISYK